MEPLANARDLRDLASRYQTAAKKLIEVAEILDGNVALDTEDQTQAPKKRNPPPIQSKGRLEGVLDFLKSHGPATRQEIHDETGFPMGTISTLLSKKHEFTRTEDGKWRIKEGQ